MDSCKLIHAIEECGFDTQSYSGRGMYGSECVGFVVERHSSNSPFNLGVKLASYFVEHEPDAIEDLEQLVMSHDEEEC